MLYSFEQKKRDKAARYEIKCINKPERDNQVDSITNVGGVNLDGKRWKQSVTVTIQEIENESAEFFVKADNRIADVFVVTTRFGKKYIRTEPDDTKKDNLLSLPECP